MLTEAGASTIFCQRLEAVKMLTFANCSRLRSPTPDDFWSGSALSWATAVGFWRGAAVSCAMAAVEPEENIAAVNTIAALTDCEPRTKAIETSPAGFSPGIGCERFLS